MRRTTRIGLAVVLLAVGAVLALLLPANWSCPPMGFCPVVPHDLNAPYRIAALVVVVGAVVLLLPLLLPLLLYPLIRRTFHGQGSQAP